MLVAWSAIRSRFAAAENRWRPASRHSGRRGEEAEALKQEAGYQARRRVVERTHSRMNRSRRISIRWEKEVENYIGMLHLVCAWITYRSAGLLG